MQQSPQVIEKYKNLFKVVNPRIDFFEVDKSFYKQKFQFRIAIDAHAMRKHYNNTWQFRRIIDEKGQCRFREEGQINIYTNDTNILDFILSEKKLYNHIYDITTTSTQYISELEKIGNIAVDIKFLNPKKMSNGCKYEIEFNEWKLIEPFSPNYRQSRSNSLTEIIEFCKKNVDDVEVYSKLLDWYNYHKKESKRPQHGFFPTTYYGKVSIYVKNEDIILQLVLMYQEKIRKIYKLIERVKQ